jgi:hypothetical protein
MKTGLVNPNIALSGDIANYVKGKTISIIELEDEYTGQTLSIGSENPGKLFFEELQAMLQSLPETLFLVPHYLLQERRASYKKMAPAMATTATIFHERS